MRRGPVRKVFKGRIFFSTEDREYPGWHVQYYVAGEIHSQALCIDDPHRAQAVIAAARFLGCRPEEIQVQGKAWPSKRPPGQPVDADFRTR